MRVVLKVVGGKNDGREIAIAIPRFIVGRGETAHLRPASDLVSREHTSIEMAGDKVIITDLKSRNGTFVNGNKITAPHEARAGDSVRIGRLQFEMVIDHVQAGAKKPKITNVIDAAARTLASKKSSLEDSISDWLMEAGEDDEMFDSTKRTLIATAETMQFKLDETTSIRQPDKNVDADSPSDEPSASDSQAGENEKPGKKSKSKPMKLPPMEKSRHDSSTSAADDVLKKFFNRR